MKLIKIVITIFILLFFSGCQLISTDLSTFATDIQETTVETTTDVPTTENLTNELPTTDVPSTNEATTDAPTNEEPTTIEVTTEIPTSETITTEATTNVIDIAYLDEIYQTIILQIPSSYDDDLLLPTINDENVILNYYLNDVLLDNHLIEYIAQSHSKNMTLRIALTIQETTVSYTINITQLYDEFLFQEAILESHFNNVFNDILNQIPSIIYSDFTLPKIDDNDAIVEYSTDEVEIFDQRIVFTFPEEDETMMLTIYVNIEDQQRTINVPITLSGYNQLPKIPRIYIYTDDSVDIESKEEYVTGYLNLIEFNHMNQENILLDGVRLRIRLRGNSTLHMPKKSFKIKFDDKQYMFSDYREKDWVLLANFSDQTLIRNALAYQMASDLNMEFAPMVQFVDVYINGIFYGNYLLTDQVEVTNDRVRIEENSSSIDTGYLIEYDLRLYHDGIENTLENYFIVDGIPFVIKSPNHNDDHYSSMQYLYIKTYVENLFSTLKNNQDYHHLIDEATFIDWFIVNEVFKNVDSGFSSIFYYKDAGGLLKMGPVWDFDLSSGNYGHLQEYLRGPEGWYTSRSDKNILFHYLMNYEGFRTALKDRWNEVYDSIILGVIDEINPMVDSIAKSRYDNFITWDIIGKYDDWFIAPETLALDTYEAQVFFLKSFLIDRINWLNIAINNLDEN